MREVENMERRKEIISEYKRRKLQGGVYRIINTQSGKYLLQHTTNLQSVQNHFQFAIATCSTVHPKLQKEWRELGPQAFKLEILEELEQGPDQSEAQFREDLETLEQMWRANLDVKKDQTL